MQAAIARYARPIGSKRVGLEQHLVERGRRRELPVPCTQADPSAADLKFLHRVPRVRLRNFKSKSGTRIIELLVRFGFRSSYSRVPRFITHLQTRALVFPPA